MARRGLCTNALSQLGDIPTVWHDIVTVVLLWYFRSYALVLLVKHSMEACVYVLWSSVRSEKVLCAVCGAHAATHAADM